MSSFSQEKLKPLPVEPIEMIAINLDGTLLRKNGNLDTKTVTAVEETTRKDILKAVASARPPQNTQHIYPHLRLNTWQISHNGILVYDQPSPQLIEHRPIDRPVARQVIEPARRISKLNPIRVEVVYMLYTDAAGRDLDSAHMGLTDSGKPFNQLLDGSITKIFMIGPPNQLGEIRSVIQQHLHGQVDFITSHLRLLQVIRAGVDKARAAAAPCGNDRARSWSLAAHPTIWV